MAGSDPDAECAPDACSGGKACSPGALLLSEFVAAPSGSEFIEIHNPSAAPVSLSKVWLADFAGYHGVTTASAMPIASDFLVQFPTGAQIAAGGYVVVSLASASEFQTAFSALPDFDFDANDNGAPAMSGTFGNSSGLTNGSEVVILFRWDGVTSLVEDLDIVVYGDDGDAVDKTGITVGNDSYKNDTTSSSQSIAAAPATNGATARCQLTEGTETKSGGNGRLGHDETSEDLATTWSLHATPTPGTASPCP
jgi:hypothetical protein